MNNVNVIDNDMNNDNDIDNDIDLIMMTMI